jgi:hypothetical protein
MGEQGEQVGMSLHDDFYTSLDPGQFTYAQARDWLVAKRFGRPVYQSQVYDLLINPLLMRKLIQRVGRGLYLLSSSLEGGQLRSGKEEDAKEPSSPPKDEFDHYLKEKGVK